MYRNGLITGYILRYKSDSGTPQFITAQNSTLSHQLKGLKACTRYTLRIAAENKAGIGPFSDPTSFVTMAPGKSGICQSYKACSTSQEPKLGYAYVHVSQVNLSTCIYVYIYIHTENVEFTSNVSFLNVSLISIVMVWDSPLDDSDAIAFYEVNYTHSAISTTTKVSKAVFNLSGLNPGTKVDFVVRAITRCGTANTVFAVTKSTKAVRTY